MGGRAASARGGIAERVPPAGVTPSRWGPHCAWGGRGSWAPLPLRAACVQMRRLTMNAQAPQNKHLRATQQLPSPRLCSRHHRHAKPLKSRHEHCAGCCASTSCERS
jgi:hypothetical protein